MNNIQQSMNYIQIEKHGDPEVLKLHSMPVPEPGPGPWKLLGDVYFRSYSSGCVCEKNC